MDNMLEENKNLKSQIKDTPHALPVKDSEAPVSYETSGSRLRSYNKTNKLISALYMVTDIMDKEEPLRNKLRNLGTNIVSDIHSSYKGQSLYNQINNKVSEVLSFIEIGSSVGIISGMNSSILIKEFLELKKLVTEVGPDEKENWLEEFMKEDKDLETKVLERGTVSMRQITLSGGQGGTRIGVQKGSTLMKALSDRIPDLNKYKEKNLSNDKADVLKAKRREEVILAIKDKMKNSINFNGATITDIKSNGHEILASCGEKTLQRELFSMVSSGILKKTGEKRWSRYLLN